MAKYIPYSMVFMTVALAVIMAGRPRPKQAVRTLHVLMAVYCVIWALLCLYVYPQYTPTE